MAPPGYLLPHRPHRADFPQRVPQAGLSGYVQTWRIRGGKDLSCTIIKALGDKFDFLAYYSDFRVDNQEASSPSDGPVGGNVTGIGQTQHDQSRQVLESRCTQGRFQLGFAQPVFVGSNEMQERPPEGAPSAAVTT
jgi:hypothetical protein